MYEVVKMTPASDDENIVRVLDFDILNTDEIEKAAHMQIEAFSRLIHSI